MMTVIAHPNVELQPSNIDENADLEVEKGNPSGLVQIVCPLKAGKWDIACFILQHLPNYSDIDLLVH